MRAGLVVPLVTTWCVLNACAGAPEGGAGGGAGSTGGGAGGGTGSTCATAPLAGNWNATGYATNSNGDNAYGRFPMTLTLEADCSLTLKNGQCSLPWTPSAGGGASVIITTAKTCSLRDVEFYLEPPTATAEMLMTLDASWQMQISGATLSGNASTISFSGQQTIIANGGSESLTFSYSATR